MFARFILSNDDFLFDDTDKSYQAWTPVSPSFSKKELLNVRDCGSCSQVNVLRFQRTNFPTQKDIVCTFSVSMPITVALRPV